jgi:hypothetical protein
MALRGGLAVFCFATSMTAAALVFMACSSDELSAAGAGDGGPDVGPNPTTTVNPPPPPPNFPDAPAPPDDLKSRSGFMGNATLIADIGEPTDGPAWRNADGALYFTVPGSANPLRRLVPGGTPTIVSVDAGSFAPVGIANSGGATLYLTEREAIVSLDVGDAGEVTSFTRMAGLGGTSFSDIHSVPPGPTSYFVDIANTRLYDFVPPNQMSLLVEVPDAGKTTAIAARESAGLTKVYVSASTTQYGSGILEYSLNGISAPQLTGVIDLQGIAANGIAVDTLGRLFVASAGGIDIVNGDEVQRQSDGYAILPIYAIPTSLAFGGADGKTLFVTTNKGKIYSIAVQTTGKLR